MPTKSKVSTAHGRKRPDPEMDLGKPDETERHPRIEHAMHLHDGHPVVKGANGLRVADVLRALVREHLPVPRRLAQSQGSKLSEEDIAACIEYSAEFMANLPALGMEMTRLRAALEALERTRK